MQDSTKIKQPPPKSIRSLQRHSIGSDRYSKTHLTKSATQSETLLMVKSEATAMIATYIDQVGARPSTRLKTYHFFAIFMQKSPVSICIRPLNKSAESSTLTRVLIWSFDKKFKAFDFNGGRTSVVLELRPSTPRFC